MNGSDETAAQEEDVEALERALREELEEEIEKAFAREIVRVHGDE